MANKHKWRSFLVRYIRRQCRFLFLVECSGFDQWQSISLLVVERYLSGASGLGGSNLDGSPATDRDLVGGSVDRVVTGSADRIDGYPFGAYGRFI